MQSPELLLSGLNRALRELRGAAHVLKDEKIDETLRPIMRRLLVAEAVGREWVVAVGGSQSAGKTTLVRTMYGLDQDEQPWLRPNEGLGEKLPILVQEDSACRRAQGYVRELSTDASTHHFEVTNREVDVQEFWRAVRGELPEVMLPILKVPRRFFGQDGQSLMLLPGYEPRRAENAAWQDLMRQVLIGAAGCLIVTDQTRLANAEQQQIVRDMLSNELRTTRPLVVVSKTESFADQPERLDELRQTAASVFGLEGAAAHTRVIFSGTDNQAYQEVWLPKLAAVLHDLSVGGGETRQMQLTRLEELLNRDLQSVLNLIQHRAIVFGHASGGGDEGARAVMQQCLGTFDDACSELKAGYRKAIEDMLKPHFGAAWAEMQRRLAEKHEGFGNKVVNCFESVSEAQQRLEADVSSAWRSPGEILPKYAQSLSTVTAPCLRGRAQPMPQISASPANVLQQLGYVDTQGQVVESKLTDPALQANVAALLGSSRLAESATPPGNREFERTVRLLPAMALEYTRLASVLPPLVGVHPTTLKSVPSMDLLDSAKRVQSQFEEFRGVASTLLRGFALMLAVDVAVDGQVDTIPALLSGLGLVGGSGATAGGAGAVAAGTGAAVASAVTGVVAVGYLVHAAMQEVRRHDGQVRALAHAMLLGIQDQHLLHFTGHFDELMGRLRSHLQQSLRRRYGLDRRLMEQDRLAKALADVEALKYEMASELSHSGQTLLPFDELHPA